MKARTFLTGLSVAAMAAATIGVAATTMGFGVTAGAVAQAPRSATAAAPVPDLRTQQSDQSGQAGQPAQSPQTPQTNPTSPWPTTSGPNAGSGNSGSNNGNGNGGGYGRGGRSGLPGQSSGYPTSTAATTTAATAEQSTGLVLINTQIDYGTGEASGTGMIIQSDGIVVTNHHVVADSTQVSVTVPTTGKTYAADVLGYDTTADVAVLQLEGASGLPTVTTTSSAVSTGQSITAVGNAEGGQQLIAAPGQVTATGVNITVTEDDGSGTAKLSGLIQVNAALVPGDSGGAMYNTNTQVIGMNVAGSTNPTQQQSYAIPISTVMKVAQQVLSGQASSTVTVGRGAALGIQASSQPTSGGVLIVGVVRGGAADEAGIAAGSTLTKLNGQAIPDTATLTDALAQLRAGDKASVSWTDPSGQSRTATVTLGAAPLP